ncbi:DUF547 domain-containing protein [Winogradskyella tangerina]|uniref:DUF547 domain-containing protein n=1 Tax=Winogradskyella tangerina TaxID=2023240 RepID=UPI000DBE9F48|nr:DUF547 domain-containing protein [Winogradskyella tangerina]
MKYISILLLAVVLFSCGGTKNVVQDQSNTTQEVSTSESPEVQDSIPVEEPIQTEKSSIQKESQPTDSVINVSRGKTISIHDAWNDLLQKYVSSEGEVDYGGFKSDKAKLRSYIDALSELSPNNEWLKNETLAYWINAYNALTIDLILRNYPLESIKDIKDPWDQRLWKFGEKWINLNDIEHKILRKMNEPRIHFAIVCASESCPKLLNEAFTANTLETQLSDATRGFLSDTSKNEISENEIKLSKIFKWFAKDFKTEGSLIDFLNAYTDVNISNKAKKSFKDYDWSLNN